MSDNHEVGCTVALLLVGAGYAGGGASVLLLLGLLKVLRRLRGVRE